MATRRKNTPTAPIPWRNTDDHLKGRSREEGERRRWFLTGMRLVLEELIGPRAKVAQAASNREILRTLFEAAQRFADKSGHPWDAEFMAFREVCRRYQIVSRAELEERTSKAAKAERNRIPEDRLKDIIAHRDEWDRTHTTRDGWPQAAHRRFKNVSVYKLKQIP